MGCCFVVATIIGFGRCAQRTGSHSPRRATPACEAAASERIFAKGEYPDRIAKVMLFASLIMMLRREAQ